MTTRRQQHHATGRFLSAATHIDNYPAGQNNVTIGENRVPGKMEPETP